MNEMGFNEIATGYFGETTVQAVEAFQLANNLEATGIVDQDTDVYKRQAYEPLSDIHRGMR